MARKGKIVAAALTADQAIARGIVCAARETYEAYSASYASFDQCLDETALGALSNEGIQQSSAQATTIVELAYQFDSYGYFL